MAVSAEEKETQRVKLAQEKEDLRVKKLAEKENSAEKFSKNLKLGLGIATSLITAAGLAGTAYKYYDTNYSKFGMAYNQQTPIAKNSLQNIQDRELSKVNGGQPITITAYPHTEFAQSYSPNTLDLPNISFKEAMDNMEFINNANVARRESLLNQQELVRQNFHNVRAGGMDIYQPPAEQFTPGKRRTSGGELGGFLKRFK